MKKGSFIVNAGANLAGFAFSIVIGFWFTPFLIHHLGTAVYGLVPLSITVVGYFGIINAALNNSVSRFLTVAIEKQDDETANQVFNASFFGTLGMVLLLLPVAVVVTLMAERLIRVPPGFEMAARQLFGFTLGSLLLNTLVTPFGVSTFSSNRFDLRNIIGIAQNLLRVGVVVGFFTFCPPELWHVGLGVLLSTMFFAAGSVFLWRKLTPMLRLSWSMVSRKMLLELSATGGWVLITQIATVLLLGIDLVVVNRMFGPTAGGQYATALQWSSLLRTLAITVLATFSPTIISFYARGQLDAMVEYTGRSMRIVGLGMALPIGLVCGFSPQLLSLWVGPEFLPMSLIQRILVAHLCINLVTIPLYSVNLAANRVRIPAMADIIAGVLNLTLAILFAQPWMFGITGVAIAGASVLTAKNLIFLPLYTAHTVKKSWWVFNRNLIPGILGTLFVAISGVTVARCLPIHSLIILGCFAAAIALCYVPIAYFILMRPDDRALVGERLLPLLRMLNLAPAK